MVFAATSLLESFSDNYPNTDLYFACHPQFANILNGNPYIKKVIPHTPQLENEIAMIGHPNHEGYVDYYINLNNSVLKNISLKKSHAFC